MTLPLPLFEAACVVVVALALAAMVRLHGASRVLSSYAALAVAGWIGEQTCILAYRFYAYAPGWHFRIGEVPLLVPLIWPLVILSARDVVSALWPQIRLRAVAVAAVVVVDASLVEVVAVRAGLWSWAEPGHLGVPVIGILGWAFFAFGAELALSRERSFLAIVSGPLAAHALIFVTWWGLFRWTMRGELGTPALIVVVALAVVAVVLVLLARRGGRAMPLATSVPRMIAASLFFALLPTIAPPAALLAHVVAVAVPYLAATRL